MQGIGLPRGHCETECTREGFGTIKVELLEFKPGQVGDLDGGIDGTPAVFASVGTVLAVEVGVPVACDQVVVVSHVSLLRSEGFLGMGHRAPRARATTSAGLATVVPLQEMCRSGRTRTRRWPYSWHNRGSSRTR